MSLSCDYGSGEGEWWWKHTYAQVPLNTKRGRRCCSCEDIIRPGEICTVVSRMRIPNDDIEERIHGDEVPMCDWHLCEKCSDLAASIDELGLCYTLGDQSLKDQIKEYRGDQT